MNAADSLIDLAQREAAGHEVSMDAVRPYVKPQLSEEELHLYWEDLVAAVRLHAAFLGRRGPQGVDRALGPLLGDGPAATAWARG